MNERDIRKRIRGLREQFGLTQVQLAERLGVTFATVNRWENGVSRPSRLALLRLTELEERSRSGRSYTSGAARRSGSVNESPDGYTVTQQVTEDSSPVESLLDFGADPEVVRLVAEGERLALGHLFNPSFATETSLIDPLPHQRIAVYEHMLLQPRLRFLLADDAGAGKTIMAGLYIREVLTRRLIRRILIVPPAGLVGNWERELRTLFNLPFHILSGAESKADNPFVGPWSNFLIVSVDTLSGGRTLERLEEQGVEPYDLVVFDEAHKLSADRNPDLTIRKTERYKLAESLAPRCHHLLLLTATPHMGKDYPYFALWRLLEPDVLTTPEAFHGYPPEARAQHFIRRTKEEMVYYDGRRIYPERESQTVSYDLARCGSYRLGEPCHPCEQRLYDETTNYIQTFYNRARILNRSAARLAMTVFQRRLASSTYALMRSFERRLEKLDDLIEDIRSGRLTVEALAAEQRRLEGLPDVWGEMTADEESPEDGLEQNEVVERLALAGVVAASLAELQAERAQVAALLKLAREVYEAGEESKFEKLREFLRDERFRDEKILIFTEHRDTLSFLVRRLEGLGFAGQIAMIHGGMPYAERDAQIEIFRKPECRFLVGTDAAGEGINLQFCWLMVNYDIPWNPARLEQRMGRIHRYKQQHDPVVIINLVAGKTREGRVLQTLLRKLEDIRRELGSDKVFDVIGRQFEGISLMELILRAVVNDEAEAACRDLEGLLTPEQVRARIEATERLLSTGGDVKIRLPEEKEKLARDNLRRLLPGYVRRFVEYSAPILGVRVEGDLERDFSLNGLPDALLPVLEQYDRTRRSRFSVYKPTDLPAAPPACRGRDADRGAAQAGGPPTIYLHPGEPVFDAYRDYFCTRFARHALRGGVFVDPYADRPYLFHLAEVSVLRKSDPAFPDTYGKDETLDLRLVGLSHVEGGPIEEVPVELLMVLTPGRVVPPNAGPFAATAAKSLELVEAHIVERILGPLAEERRKALLSGLGERELFVQRGLDYQEAELAAVRARLAERVREGDSHARGELTNIRDRQRELGYRRDRALAALRREPDLIVPGEIRFIAHALVVPSSDPADRERHDKAIEQIAVRVAWGYEESLGARVEDVSDPRRAMGFDLLSRRPGDDERAIEVKGRRRIGDVQLTENEWVKAANLRDKYWLYVVFDCATASPRLLRVRDPFARLLVQAKGGVVVDEKNIFEAAEGGEDFG